MQKAMQRRAELGRAQLMQYQMRFQYLNPEAKLRDNRQRLADLDELLRRAMKKPHCRRKDICLESIWNDTEDCLLCIN